MEYAILPLELPFLFTAATREDHLLTKKKKAGGPPPWIYGLLGVLLLVAGYRLMGRNAEPAAHPSVRVGITSAKVLPASAFTAQPDVARVYAMAETIPEVLDGLYCHCECSKHSGHYSLLTCFESDHGSKCDICLGEAELAYKMAKEGKTLDQIRVAIDAQFG
jgi:hypothetical protein